MSSPAHGAVPWAPLAGLPRRVLSSWHENYHKNGIFATNRGYPDIRAAGFAPKRLPKPGESGHWFITVFLDPPPGRGSCARCRSRRQAPRARRAATFAAPAVPAAAAPVRSCLARACPSRRDTRCRVQIVVGWAAFDSSGPRILRNLRRPARRRTQSCSTLGAREVSCAQGVLFHAGQAFGRRSWRARCSRCRSRAPARVRQKRNPFRRRRRRPRPAPLRLPPPG